MLLFIAIFACFSVGVFARHFLGNGWLAFVCILTITVCIFVATNLRIITEIHDNPSISSILIGLLFSYAIPYLLLYFLPALLGALTHSLFKRLWK